MLFLCGPGLVYNDIQPPEETNWEYFICKKKKPINLNLQVLLENFFFELCFVIRPIARSAVSFTTFKLLNYAPTLPLLRNKPQKNDNLPAFAKKKTNGARHPRSTAEFFYPCAALTGRSAKIG
jgi:hypothetical protein